MAEEKREATGRSSTGSDRIDPTDPTNPTDPTDPTAPPATEAELKDAALNDAVLSHVPNSGPRTAAERHGEESEPPDSDGQAAQEPTGRRRRTGNGSGGEPELVSAGAAAQRQSRSSGSAATGRSGSTAAGRSRKTEATARQTRAEPKPKRTTPAQFVRESVGELRKVVYPTGSQLANYFVVVLVFVLFIIGVVSLLDLGFGWVIFRVFG